MKYKLSFLILLTFLFSNRAQSQNDYILKTCGNNSLYGHYRPVHIDDGSLYIFNLFTDSIEQDGIITDSSVSGRQLLVAAKRQSV